MNYTFHEILSIALAGFLFVFSLLLFTFRRANHELISFGLTALFLSLALLLRFEIYNLKIYQAFNLLIWPCFFLFFQQQYKRSKWQWNHLGHFMIAILWLLFLNIVPVALGGGVFEALYLIQFLLYLALSLAEIHKATRHAKNEAYFKPYYLKFLFNGLIVLLILRFILPILINNSADVTDIFLLFVAGYLIIISGFFIAQPVQTGYKNEDASQSHELANYEEEMKRKLIRIMERDKAYLNPELTLNHLSALAEVKLPELSSFINTNLGKNFNDYVNDYRVAEFKRLISKDIDPRATIMELAYESGFNSKASFNRIFKAHVGSTPSQFKRDIKNSLNAFK